MDIAFHNTMSLSRSPTAIGRETTMKMMGLVMVVIVKWKDELWGFSLSLKEVSGGNPVTP